MVTEFKLSAMQGQRIEQCRRQYNAFTGSNLSFSEYLNDILSAAIRSEEVCCKRARAMAPCRAVN